ncbi:zinc ABC transporter substrate-binding protein [Saccharopolyspora sp. HNM0983]|uniref:Zinc ABC transporter substrate-binding protein n=1 Tax=Saccharopolyspora montiporae TaxID=2781240 RepID=A0A929G0Y6_9PSEU|nr:zinc ABC transporter substrate-binding protein [Saccharopolyspora sp. HNM0983]MBE9374108.1 zinc ABC transporter substrate-binding protein [Saccharopolyspora sp. HNM0983]
MTRRGRTGTAVAVLVAAALAASACGTGQDGGGADGKVQVTTSTNVWADVVRAVGGDAVEVTPLITDTAADPHSYESSPRDAADVADADLVVHNGGGYDEFMDRILAADDPKPTVQAFSDEDGGEQQGAPGEGHEHAHAHGSNEHGGEHEHAHGSNEHVWYDLHVVHEVGDRIADELAQLRPAEGQRFHDSATEFTRQIGGLEQQVGEIAEAHRGKQVIVTEPVAQYLIDSAGLQDSTPPSFVDAIESETDPSAAAVAQIQDAVRSGQAAAVIHNPQTETPVTRDVRESAQQRGIPVVEMTETLPEGRSYVDWMGGQITALRDALGDRP